ncbi:ArsR family transcriptional regulator [Microbacterium pseudoresistens]|uniref:Putative ArsR family transcriptional regulator n=1 Tax=Microbacterium pseudoresistens TaxID=640634 RepID=A0A7Y9JMF6_9MICO|nr:putative ArsR family transcriptional regulator [Microbacterium pseudoresistens]
MENNPGGSGRERVLAALESRMRTIPELVHETGLHENTVRGHLERLRAEGLIRRERQDPDGRGRPAWRWSLIDARDADPALGLVVALAESLSDAAADPSARARAAGVAWGRRLAAQRAEQDGPALVAAVMQDQGFAPEKQDAPGADDSRRMRLLRCPLLAAARGRTDTVCAVHEGLVEGLLRARDDAGRAMLAPFAAVGGACALSLRDAS